MFPLNFSLSVTGQGDMLKPLVQRVTSKYPGVVIYDRNEETNRPSTDEEGPFIPQVAFVEIVFARKGTKEVATIRVLHRHQFFNYDMSEAPEGSKQEEYLLAAMLNAVESLCTPPKVVPDPVIAVEENSGSGDEPDTSPDPEEPAHTESETP